MVQTYPRKKLEIIAESTVLPRIEQLLREVGAKGYTVVQGAKGFGAHGTWFDDTLTQADRMLLVEVILTAEAADEMLGKLVPLFETWRGVAAVSDVQVLRPDRF